MEEKEVKNNESKNDDMDFDFSGFGDEGAQVLSTEQLNEIKKKLPKWSIVPPAKYKK